MNTTSIDLGDESIEVAEFGSGAGPALTVFGGVHGDEWEGIVAARMFAASLVADEIHGRIRIVAVANPPAHRALTRTSPPDGLNLARVFPGRSDGSITERLAHALTTELIAGADLFVDLHSAGEHYEMPVFAGYWAGGPTGEASGDAARAFGAPILWKHTSIGPGRTIGAAAECGVAAVYVEGSGGGQLRGGDLDIYLRGLRRLSFHLGLIDAPPLPPALPPLVIEEGDGNVDSSLCCTVAGLCVTRVRTGDDVAAGTTLAEIVGEDGEVLERLTSPFPARVMMLRRTAPICAGDGVAMLAPHADRDRV